MTQFASSSENKKRIDSNQWASKRSLLVIAVVLLLNFIFCFYQYISIKRQAILDLQIEFAEIQKNLHSAISVIALDSNFVDSVEQGNYAESMRTIVAFRDGKIADNILVYKPDYTLYVDSSKPGLFGLKDSLSGQLEITIQSDKIVDSIEERNGMLQIFSCKSIRSLNGTAGVIVAGQNIQNVFSNITNKNSLYPKNISIVDADRQKFFSRNLYVSSVSGMNLPKGKVLKAEIPSWTNAGLIVLFQTFLMIAITIFSFRFWSRYKNVRENLRLEEEARIRSARLVSLGEMSAGIAHEINNPLAVIQMSESQMRKLIRHGEMPAELRERAEVICDRIDRTVHRINVIIKGLRAFARDGSHEEMTKISLKQVLKETLDICAMRPKFKNIEFRHSADATNDYILGRSVQLSQVFVNLINNAIDAIGDSPSCWISIEIRNLNNGVEVWITDSGPGIPREIREKIMEPFSPPKKLASAQAWA